MKTKQTIFDIAFFSSIVVAGIILIPEPSSKPILSKSEKHETFFEGDKYMQQKLKNEKLDELDTVRLISRF